MAGLDPAPSTSWRRATRGDAALAVGALCPRGAAGGGAEVHVDVGEKVAIDRN